VMQCGVWCVGVWAVTATDTQSRKLHTNSLSGSLNALQVAKCLSKKFASFNRDLMKVLTTPSCLLVIVLFIQRFVRSSRGYYCCGPDVIAALSLDAKAAQKSPPSEITKVSKFVQKREHNHHQLCDRLNGRRSVQFLSSQQTDDRHRRKVSLSPSPRHVRSSRCGGVRLIRAWPCVVMRCSDARSLSLSKAADCIVVGRHTLTRALSLSCADNTQTQDSKSSSLRAQQTQIKQPCSTASRQENSQTLQGTPPCSLRVDQVQSASHLPACPASLCVAFQAFPLSAFPPTTQILALRPLCTHRAGRQRSSLVR
jgi:hypothetical protein